MVPKPPCMSVSVSVRVQPAQHFSCVVSYFIDEGKWSRERKCYSRIREPERLKLSSPVFSATGLGKGFGGYVKRLDKMTSKIMMQPANSAESCWVLANTNNRTVSWDVQKIEIWIPSVVVSTLVQEIKSVQFSRSVVSDSLRPHES